ncbi:MAG: TlpA disulfide reductase family protein [Arcobacteraceae bacterium]
MRKKLLPLLGLIAVLFFVGCESKPKQAQVVESVSSDTQKMEQPASYTLTTTKGEKITFEVSDGVLFSKQLNNKMVLLNFWATWCPPCIKEMPSFIELQETYKDDFIIIGVLFEKEKDQKELADFMKKHKINFPITVGAENFKLAKELDDVNKIPESFLYSKEGFFIEKFVGEIKKSVLENHIKSSMM